MALSDEDLAKLAERLKPQILEHIVNEKPWRRNILIPSIDVYRSSPSDPFMEHSTPSARDYFHPEFKRICDLLEIGDWYSKGFPRKLWEWVYIVHHAFRSGAVGQGKRALGFGVGSEKIPSVFVEAGARVRATDAPPEIGIGHGWTTGSQFAQGVHTLLCVERLRRDLFEKIVEFSECDMNNIDPSLTGYDFCWSSCALEHLGGLQQGFDFIVNSVEKTLKVGGVAVHTTEFNLSSNTTTIDSGWTVIYRRCDIEDLIAELRARGHKVSDIRIALDSLAPDHYVDVPPYLHAPHLKLELGGYVSTSIGLVIQRGR